MLYDLCPGIQCYDLLSIGGTLYNLIEQKTAQGFHGLDEDTVIEIMSEIVNGVIHLHMQEPPIAHRDLKV